MAIDRIQTLQVVNGLGVPIIIEDEVTVIDRELEYSIDSSEGGNLVAISFLTYNKFYFLPYRDIGRHLDRYNLGEIGKIFLEHTVEYALNLHEYDENSQLQIIKMNYPKSYFDSDAQQHTDIRKKIGEEELSEIENVIAVESEKLTIPLISRRIDEDNGIYKFQFLPETGVISITNS